MRGAWLIGVVAGAVLAAPAYAHLPGERPADLEPRSPAPFARQAQEPSGGATPRASCRPGSRPEPSIQGRLPKAEVDAGRADQGYWCNVKVIGRSGSTGGFRVHRYIDRHGRECAYYDTALLFPTNALSLAGEPTGVAVLDMSDPARPRRTTTLLTPAMQSPHESLNISVQRGVLAAVLGNPAQYPGGVDVYDISEDCRNPRPMAAAFPASPFGHESGMAPDGLTFYPTSPGSSDTTAVDISDPRLPRQIWNGDFDTHGMSVSDDGNRGYFAALSGLIITDLSQVQARRPNPQVPVISRLTWPNMTIPQIAIPVTIKGRPYLVEVDEYSQSAGGGSVAAHGPRVGAARIIDISDERSPRVVSNVRLDVHQPENRAGIAEDYGTQSPVQGYAAHYCNVPRRAEPGILACSMILSGLRVFDIRDPLHPREIAYYMAPPSTISGTGGPIIDERANWAMSQPAFAPERGEIWYSDGTSGFYALKLDPEVWPFPTETGPAGCTGVNGLRAVKLRRAARGLFLGFNRRRRLPVRVDVFRVSSGTTVLRGRRVATFAGRHRSFTWRTRLAPGFYVARYRMLDGRRVVDTQHVVFRQGARGVSVRPPYYRRESCQLLRAFKLDQPVFGGTGAVPLRAYYRLTQRADVTVTITRRGRTVHTFTNRNVAPGRTVRLTLPARALARGDYRVRLVASGAEDQVAATLVARRL